LTWINGAARVRRMLTDMMMAANQPDDAVLVAVAGYFAALAEPTRLRIVHALCRGERSVGRIVADTGVSQTTVSRQLALLHRHGMTTRRRDGKRVYYRIADETMPEVCRAVCSHIASAMDERRPLRRQLLALIPGRGRRAA
jgi:DNA-binding transcriptional ArsR family regulator